MDKIMSDKERLIAHLEILRDAEESKPVNEKDNELIRACIVLLLDLQGKKLTLTEEEIEERVRNFPFVAENKGIDNQKNTEGKNKKVSKKKVLLVAACIAILVALFSIASIAFKWNIFEELKNRFGTVADTPIGIQQQMNGITVTRDDEDKYYYSIDEVIENEDLNILFPTYLPEETRITGVSVCQYNGHEEVVIIFNESNMSWLISIDENLDTKMIETASETLKINGKECYIVDIVDLNQVQICFVYDDNVYTFKGTDKNVIIKIIESLKE